MYTRRALIVRLDLCDVGHDRGCFDAQAVTPKANAAYGRPG